MCGFIAQLVEHRTGIAEVMGSIPVEALIFFRLHETDPRRKNPVASCTAKPAEKNRAGSHVLLLGLSISCSATFNPSSNLSDFEQLSSVLELRTILPS